MTASENASVRPFEEIMVGERAQFEVALTAEIIDEFAKVSGDFNPLHMDEGYASETAFSGRIAHGMLGGAFFSRLIGMYLPGARSLYLSQSLFFRKPMRLGTMVVVSGEVLHKSESLRTLTLKMSLSDAHSGEVLTDGEAIVKIL